MMKKGAKSFTELDVYQRAFAFQQVVFQRSKKWPKEEMYALTDQVRRSTRSVGAASSGAAGDRALRFRKQGTGSQ